MSTELIAGSNRIVAITRTRQLAATGNQIMSCLSLTYTPKLSQAGDFTATFALRDPNTDQIQCKSRLLDFYVDGTFEYRGLVEKIATSVDNTGNLVLSVSGRDMAAELAESTVGFLTLRTVAGPDINGVNDAPAQIIAAANASASAHSFGVVPPWSLIGESETVVAVYAEFMGESALSALVKVAERTGEQWRVAQDGSRSIEWLGSSLASSGVRAEGSAGDVVAAENNPYLCLIQAFSAATDATTVVNRVYPYGAGDGGARMTLAATSRVPPSGFGYDPAENWIQNSNAIVASVRPSEAILPFKDIRPLSNTDGDLEAAANALFDSALVWLQANDEPTDKVTYTLAVAKLPPAVQVGTTIRVLYGDDRFAVDKTLIVMAIAKAVASDGGRGYTLTVRPVAAWPSDENTPLIGAIEQGQVFTSHPQQNINSDTLTYRVFVGGDQTADKAELRFWFGEEIVQISRVLFRFVVAPIVSTSTTVGGTVATAVQSAVTTTEGSSSNTTASGSSHHHGVAVADDTPPSVYQVYVAPDGHFTTIGGVGGGTITPTSNSESSHTHGMTHTHEFPHTHSVDVGAALTTSYGLHRATSGETYSHGEGASALEISVNGYKLDGLTSGYSGLEASTGIGSDWYELDLTSVLYDGTTFRPKQAANLIEIRRKSGSATNKTAMIDAQLNIRSIIQNFIG